MSLGHDNDKKICAPNFRPDYNNTTKIYYVSRNFIKFAQWSISACVIHVVVTVRTWYLGLRIPNAFHHLIETHYLCLKLILWRQPPWTEQSTTDHNNWLQVTSNLGTFNLLWYIYNYLCLCIDSSLLSTLYHIYHHSTPLSC